MDAEKVIDRVERFLTLIEASLLQDVTGTVIITDPDLDSAIRMELPLIQKLAEHEEAGLGSAMAPRTYMGEWPWSSAKDSAIRLLGLLRTGNDLEALLAPTGPRLAANRLHRWVWEAAAHLWDDGHRRYAIQAAATAVERELQSKLNSHGRSGKDLVIQAFRTPAPKVGEKRLRFPQLSPDSNDWTSAHEGAMAFGQGCMQAIRNPSTHLPSEPDEQVALEHLASLSVLARWIDTAEVVEG